MQEKGGHLGCILRRLVPIAAHVDFLQGVGDLLLLQLQPDLLAVRAPSCMIPEELHSRRARLPKGPFQRQWVGGSLQGH